MFEKEYKECLDYMYSLRRFGIKLGLKTIRGVLENLGNPHKTPMFIHIAGTNGKGSIASALSSILQEAGFKTGLYTSPHLVRFNERIRINKKDISDEEVLNAYKAVRDAACKGREMTFFEFSTAMAFYEFARNKVDLGVIETGMGGRLDATNIIEPAVSVISNIAIDHKMYLGDTIEKIAAEKAGIIKKGIPVVTGNVCKSAADVIEKKCKDKDASLYRLGKEFRARKNKNGFTYFGIKNTLKEMRTCLAGDYQIKNAAVASAVCEVLSIYKKLDVRADSIRKGLLNNRWAGRLDIVSESPFVLLDGAHNIDAARNLAKYLKGYLGYRDITLIIGILDDKPYRAMLKELVPLCSKLIITKAQTSRALPCEVLFDEARKYSSNIKIIDNVGEALKYAVSKASYNDAVCVCGSLYVVGDAKHWLEENPL